MVGAKIGGGGMASVYLGRREVDSAAGHNLVALKVIKDSLAGDRQYEDMFDDEARILSRLDHPGIIRHVDYGRSGDFGYIAMELVLGRSLMDAWDACSAVDKPMPVDLGAHVGLCVAEALDYAHKLTDEMGKPLDVIHRDVNPTNVFLTYDGQVKLIDFGLAKAAGRVHKSAEGVVKGKVPYLAPEQITEDHVDQRADIYALGATIWEMTTGRRLFKRPTDGETIRAIRAHVIPDPRTIVEGWYPESLWKIVERALAKDPNQRYTTAGELADDLRAMLAKYGRKAPMQQALAEWLEELFPGEHARQSEWLIEAAERAVPRLTMQPPAPIAEIPEVASTNKLEAASPISSIDVEPKAETVSSPPPPPPPKPARVEPEKSKPSVARALLAAAFIGAVVVAAYLAMRG